ncbi:MAG: mucoidy inhibitor MuiA family protein [Alphaproteobacteria bacterium]|nr:mucoidy inhibitor MuiA family protein [Alphaproteobacteria bacterium]
MNKFVLGTLGLAMSAIVSTAAIAEDITAKSVIESVLVFPSGAEVLRETKVGLPSGETTIVFPDLPAETVPGSIRVEGSAPGELRIGSVDQRRLFVPQSGDDNSSERQSLEDELERLRDERSLLEGRIEASRTRQTLLKNLANLPTVPPGRDGGGSGGQSWSQLLALISTGMGDVHKDILAANVEIREIDRKVADLEKQLQELSPKRVQRTQVKVFVSTDGAFDAELTLKYQVRNASWVPTYEARLDTGAKDREPALNLVRRARISQRTGEEWKDVGLKLSTTRPTSGSTAPNIRPITVDIRPPAKPKPMVGTLSMERAEKDVAGFADESKVRRRVARGAARKMAAAAPVVAKVADAPFQAVYTIAGRADVLSTGEKKSVVIGLEDLKPSLRVKAVPKKQATAFLYAKVKRQASTPLLPGAVTLFRDGTFVGKGRLPLISGEEHELGFGADDLVRVKYAVVNEKRGETGLISTTQTDNRNYKITITNLHDTNIDATVLDQMPVSANDKIQVDLTAGTAPSNTDVDDKRGVVGWDFTLKPKEERVIDFGYVVKWPSTEKITYRGR